MLLNSALISLFLSTPSARRATGRCRTARQHTEISIHALREEGDFRGAAGHQAGQHISIHALREEGDTTAISLCITTKYFYPRPPRGGRPPPQPACAICSYFYPRPPRGGRHKLDRLKDNLDKISIHALREEGDSIRCLLLSVVSISIHALREEGDSSCVR